MRSDNQTAELIDLYITTTQNYNYDDVMIIEDLLDIFSREDLEHYGFGDFIKDYFEEG